MIFLVVGVSLAGLNIPDSERGVETNQTSTPSEKTTQSNNLSQNLAESTPNNPWGKNKVIVGFKNANESSLDLESQTSSAIQYWENNGSQYADYQVDFVLEPQADNPDLVVEFTDGIVFCGSDVELSVYYGCAPLISGDDRVRNEDMEIDATMGPRNLQLTLRHEFGHVLGLNHSSQPYRYMSDTVNRSGVTDAANRSYPWYQHGNVSVAADESNLSVESGSPGKTVRDVVTFYQQNPQYLPDNYSLDYVDRAEQADIVLSEEPIGFSFYIDSGSQATFHGMNLDRDSQHEYYTYVWIQMGSSYNLKYHTGYWIGRLLGNSQSELPERFQAD